MAEIENILQLNAKTPNLLGRRFGRLLVLSFVGYLKSRAQWVCVCDCGAQKALFAKYLINGDTISCGCRKMETELKWKTHGLTHTRIYSIWRGMISRCTNPKASHYEDYGGRGIKVCDRWLESVEAFFEDTKEGYADNLTLDRVDPNGNYEPSNFRWATKLEQQNNRRDNIILTINDQSGGINQWSKISGTCRQTIISRYFRKVYTHEECVYGKKVEKWN